MRLCFNNEYTLSRQFIKKDTTKCVSQAWCHRILMIELFLILHQLQHHSHHRPVLLHRHLPLSLLQLEALPLQLETLLLDISVLPLFFP